MAKKKKDKVEELPKEETVVEETPVAEEASEPVSEEAPVKEVAETVEEVPAEVVAEEKPKKKKSTKKSDKKSGSEEIPEEPVAEETVDAKEETLEAPEKAEEVTSVSAVVEAPAEAPVKVEAPKAEDKPAQKSKKELRKEKRQYDKVLSTGSFIGSFILMLIPGVNIICVLLWALGAAKNRNKVHFSRACIVLFLIEILLSTILLGAADIYVMYHEDLAINYLDKQTNGLLSYFDINHYEDLIKLKDVSNYLVEKETDEPTEEEEPPVIEPVNYVYNPIGITSYDEFLALWNATKEEPADEADPVDDENSTEVEDTAPSTLAGVLEANNIDPEKSQTVYIIIDNDKEKCVIAFDPTGKLQSYPKLQINEENIYVGGAY